MTVKENRNIKTFKELNPGNVFLWAETYLIKLKSRDSFQGANLKNGEIYFFHEDSQVQLVDAELIITL